MKIRAYEPKDKERLRMICKETAWDEYKKDENKLESVPIMFNDYFTELEPEYVFVLADEEKDEAYGYIICATDYDKFVEAMQGEYTRRVLAIAPEEKNFIDMIVHHLSCIKNRAIHFHIDMLPECQRQGLGTKLINTLMNKLKTAGFDHLSVCGVSRSAASYALCMKMGFEEIYDYGNDVVAISILL